MLVPALFNAVPTTLPALLENDEPLGVDDGVVDGVGVGDGETDDEEVDCPRDGLP